MFFFGVFGIQTKQELVESRQGEPCPVCGAFDRYDFLREFTYFHFFFLPLWRWNYHYLIRTRCCRQIRQIPENVGEELLRTGFATWSEVAEEILQPLMRCPECALILAEDFQYCPDCGTKRN